MFFDSPYLTEGQTYIASLINYIDVHYHYDIKYDMNFTGKLTYQFVAVVSANKTEGSGTFWKKEYNLSEEKVVNVNDKDRFMVDDTVQVKYDTYNAILDKFRREYNLSTNGELKVIMRIKSSYNFSDIDKVTNGDSELNITIPLLQQAIDVSINKDVTNDKNTISFVKKDKSVKYLLFRIAGLLLVIISILGFLKSFRTVRKIVDHNQYAFELDKILKKYDAIIAEVKKIPSLTGFKIIEISKFDELLDVYNEVRMPINCCKSSKETLFVIINDNTAWVYRLKNSKISRKDDIYEEETEEE